MRQLTWRGEDEVVKTVRRLINYIPDNHVLVKLDIANAFRQNGSDHDINYRQDTRALSICTHLSSLQLTYENETNISVEGLLQEDPLSSLE